MNFPFRLADITTTPSLPAVPALTSPLPQAASTPIPPEAIVTLIFALAVVTIFLFITLSWFLLGLARNREWSIADAVSEEAGDQPTTLPPGVKPIMVASSSRLIAVVGFLVLVAMSIGVGYGIIWSIFTGRPLQIQGLLSYFYGMGTLFAPYAFNQLSQAFGAFAQTPQTPASSTQPAVTQPAVTPAAVVRTSQALLQPTLQLPVLKLPTAPGTQN